MTYENVILDKEDNLATLYINRPKAMNALNRETLLDIKAVLMDVKNDSDVKTLIITGSGEKAFVAGADIAYMHNLSVSEARAFSQLGQDVFRMIELMEKPVIAAINGFALGGGCELAMACDIRLAAEHAVFGQPEVGLGVIPGYGGTQRLARLVGEGRAKELIFTGDTIKTPEAYRIGLVNHVYPGSELMDQAKKLAGKIARQAPLAVGYSKTAVGKGLQVDIDTGIGMESDLFGMCFATEDQKEGMKAFMEKRKPDFKTK
ncbi:Crotonase superfamily [Syntrophomonas zehnderi OL-4]|uniref:short-chain-enoyl-CoA hydratase n=1 Tax=Syntrophomonas zehnderi OL-4 TaxID=690567 RepID=A0A0E4GDJ0_9FIRM|nr:short-chain-enoyl-CoA hydratase [Syntrophomonas zehnderi]CFY10325.1 Crotonase superfamily [Syntrophomonas zehnderi OL-4]